MPLKFERRLSPKYGGMKMSSFLTMPSKPIVSEKTKKAWAKGEKYQKETNKRSSPVLRFSHEGARDASKGSKYKGSSVIVSDEPREGVFGYHSRHVPLGHPELQLRAEYSKEFTGKWLSPKTFWGKKRFGPNKLRKHSWLTNKPGAPFGKGFTYPYTKYGD